MADELILEVTTAAVLELEVGTPGPPGRDGEDGTGGGGSGTSNTFIQTTDPVLTLTPGFGAYIWYVTDVAGAVTDIRKGVA